LEHPYLFFEQLVAWLGMEHFAHANFHVIYTWVVMAILIGLGLAGTKSVQIIPNKMQNFLEVIVSGIEEFMVDVTGEEGRWFLPIAATIALYIAVSNLLGLVPGFFPPTANINTPLSCALVVFVFTHYLGVKHHGAKYIKHFLGPIWWLSWLIMPIEIIGHLARVLSLTFRLFGNMMGHESVLIILFMLAGAFFAPLPIMAMGIFVSFVQAFVFFLLSIMYFSAAMEHAH
jgi:F-type H+-transporting ATPase subunit a